MKDCPPVGKLIPCVCGPAHGELVDWTGHVKHVFCPPEVFAEIKEFRLEDPTVSSHMHCGWYDAQPIAVVHGALRVEGWVYAWCPMLKKQPDTVRRAAFGLLLALAIGDVS